MKKRTNRLDGYLSGNYKLLAVLCAVLAAGVCLGAVGAASVSPQICEEAGRALREAMKQIGQNGGQEDALFWSSFLNIVRPVLLIWIAGLFGYGTLAVLLLLGFKGVLTGFSAGLFIRAYDYMGLAVGAAGILPQHAVIVPLLLALSAFAVTNSRAIHGNLLSPAMRPVLTRYVGVLLAAILVSMAAAVVDCHVTAGLLRSMANHLS